MLHQQLSLQLELRLYELLQMFAIVSGHIYINKHKELIYGVSQVLYYAFTTLSKLQTLGEEYTKIVQVGNTGKHIPGFSVNHTALMLENVLICFNKLLLTKYCFLQQSLGMILAHVFGDKLIALALDRFIDEVRRNKLITFQARDQIVHVLTVIKSLVPLFQSLNRVLFYWNGSFYTWAKRFFNIRYVSKIIIHVFR